MPSRTQRLRHLGLGVLCVAALTLAFASSLQAQVLSDPRIAEFDPSPDHWTVLGDGQPAVLRYNLDMYVVGAAAPFVTVGMGKPSPDADGKIRYDFSGALGGVVMPGGNYEARVSAVGPEGSALSDPSNPFTFTGAASCTLALSYTVLQPPPEGGSYMERFTTGTGCVWDATTTATWVTLGTSSGSGSGAVSFSVQANTSSTGRAGSIVIGGQSVSIWQDGTSGQPLRITPTLSWTPPAGITQGTPLGSLQLNAFASVPGTFVYTPSAGTVLPAGRFSLRADFTPADTASYTTATTYTTLTVYAALYRLTIAPPSNGMVTGGGLSCGTIGSVCQVSMSTSSSVNLQATPDSAYAFTGWSGDCAGTSPSLTLLVNGEKSCGASFTAVAPPNPGDLPLGAPYTLTILRPTGGAVKAAGINCGTHANNCTVSMPGPVTIGMQAVPDAGYVFVGWTGHCSGSSLSYSLALEGPRTCGATFSAAK